ncbi:MULTISPECIES: hypothetical protein [unclassified Paenibacillus]|uniref:DUF7662 domain-containing protein n=1 Tax=Paenibacillus provencensis TaxID=441151 RepID=A0ABW3PVF0_9BACL|nr:MULTISPECIES: hypothetical protein [unclassified Paenibacillus]MCM3130125.1 hypothetical protein [Paenibacillus sp. MER 78]SDX70061.1 hypothetical protein SAMN05518848_11213 [Paenibacillus sp. PDC88]SFS87939.1 hypothetical protein SAMN04488601_1069 [Paenibacillus sp. 453mf]
MFKFENISRVLQLTDNNQATLKIEHLNELVKEIDPDGFPNSAYDKSWRTWWSNNKSSPKRQCHAWLSVGWQTDVSKSKQGEYITFIRE